MKIDNKYKIEKACSTDEARRQLMDPYLQRTGKGKGLLIATDGRMMAIVPVELDKEDRSGYVPTEALAELRRQKFGATLTVNGKAEVKQGGASFTFPRQEGNFPDWKNVQPKSKVIAEVTLDPYRLNDLVKALGVGPRGESITIKIHEDMTGPVTVEGSGEAKGIIMQMKK